MQFPFDETTLENGQSSLTFQWGSWAALLSWSTETKGVSSARIQGWQRDMAPPPESCLPALADMVDVFWRSLNVPKRDPGVRASSGHLAPLWAPEHCSNLVSSKHNYDWIDSGCALQFPPIRDTFHEFCNLFQSLQANEPSCCILFFCLLQSSNSGHCLFVLFNTYEKKYKTKCIYRKYK